MIFRELIVHYKSKIGDVHSTSSDVGSNKHTNVLFLKRSHHFFPLFLIEVSMNGSCGDVFITQKNGQLFSCCFGFAEHHSPIFSLLFQESHQCTELVQFLTNLVFMGDARIDYLVLIYRNSG